MTELANWVAGAPTPMPGNYNAVGGFGFNPYDPRRDPREATFDGRPVLETGGSSSGIGTAASFWAANVGTETSGSILSPSNQNMLVGHQADRRPHQPLRRHPDHRRSGHGRADGANRRRRRDHARRARERRAGSATIRDKTLHAAAGPRLHAFLDADALKGARIGIPRAFYYERDHAARRHARRAAGSTPEQRSGDGRRDRGAEAAGRRHRRSRRHPERRRPGSEQELPALGHLPRRRRREGQGRGLLGRASSTA